jgi:hypothetical protein
VSDTDPWDASKQARFDDLRRRPYAGTVIAANRAYLAAARAEPPAGAGDRWVLTCLPSTGDGTRLSAVSMLNMETFVLHLAEGRPEPVRGFAIVRRGAALAAFGTEAAIRDEFGLADVYESSYRAAGFDQLALAGDAASLVRALADERVAEAARELADFLTRSRTVYARYHNPYLTGEVAADWTGPTILRR